MADRALPHSLDAENAVLGGIFLVNSEYYSISDFLVPEDFYQQSHKLIFAAIGELLSQNRPVDFVMIKEFMGKIGTLEAAGGIQRIAALIDGQFNPASVVHYAKIVRRLSRVRELKRLAAGVLDGEDDDPEKLEAMLEEALSNSRAGEISSLPAPECAALQADYYDTQRQQLTAPGLMTGLPALDDMTGGLQLGELSLWAGRPSTGKTSLGVTLLRNMPSVPTLFESLEQDRTMIMNRLLSAITGIELFRIRNHSLNTEEWALLYRANAKLAVRKFWIQDRAATLHQIRAEVTRRKRSDNLQLVIIDYFSLIRHELPSRQWFKVHEVYREVAKALKAMAKSLKVHVALLSQITRDLGPNEEPQLHHLAETRELENESDLVVFTWLRPGDIVDTFTNVLTIAKQRNGPIGRFDVHFRRETASFENLLDRY